jgi:large conductance mechanosensitive channel
MVGAAMGMLADFKKFALKGNIVDLAVAVVIGAAFGKIIAAVVADVVMPVVALVMPSGDWRNSGWILRHGATPKDDVVLKWGDLLGVTLDFLIVAFVLFLVVSRIVKRLEARFGTKDETTTKECPYCLDTIPIKATKCKSCTSSLAA